MIIPARAAIELLEKKNFKIFPTSTVASRFARFESS